jgi:hypothetical protein
MAGRCEGDVAWFNTVKRIVEFNIGCSDALQLEVFLYSSYLLLSAFVIQSPLVHKTWTQRTDYRRPTHTALPRASGYDCVESNLRRTHRSSRRPSTSHRFEALRGILCENVNGQKEIRINRKTEINIMKQHKRNRPMNTGRKNELRKKKK